MRVLATAATVVAALLGLSSAVSPPVFPDNFSDIEVDEMVQNQGGVPSADGKSLCCPLASQCQVETQYQSGHNYFGFAYNATRFDANGADGVMVNDFNLNLEMLVNPSTMQCIEACPLDDDLEPYQIDANATVTGTKIINGKTCTGWQWKTTIFGVIVMETETIWVATDASGNAFPVLDYVDLTPFGEEIGYESTTYLSFTPGVPDKKLFAVVGANSCPPPQDGCGNDQKLRKANRIRNRLHKTYLRAELESKFVLDKHELEAYTMLNEAREARRAGKNF